MLQHITILLLLAAMTGDKALTPLQQQGRATWYTWTGGDTDAQRNVVGDQALWRILAIHSPQHPH